MYTIFFPLAKVAEERNSIWVEMDITSSTFFSDGIKINKNSEK